MDERQVWSLGIEGMLGIPDYTQPLEVVLSNIMHLVGFWRTWLLITDSPQIIIMFGLLVTPSDVQEIQWEKNRIDKGRP